jgi:catechol 2,3-dioxygenase-like lactoylglutathione lyase family enzyme
MYDHLGLHVRDLKASIRFYEAALGALGHVLCSQDATGAGVGPKGEPGLWLYADGGTRKPGAHVAFRARTARWSTVPRGRRRPAARTTAGQACAPTTARLLRRVLTDPDGSNVSGVRAERAHHGRRWSI